MSWRSRLGTLRGAMRSDSPRGSFISSGLRWEMSQFWQFKQRKPQPVAAKEKAAVPGRKWNSGFFSIGSM